MLSCFNLPVSPPPPPLSTYFSWSLQLSSDLAAPPPLPYCCWGWGGEKKKKNQVTDHLSPASLHNVANSSPLPPYLPLSKCHSITMAKSTPTHTHTHTHTVHLVPPPILRSHPSCALSPVLIGKSVEPCQP